MISWLETCLRVIIMDTQAVNCLNRPRIAVNKYTRPTGWMLIPFIAVICTLIAFSRRGNFQAGSFFYETFLTYAPGFAQWCFKIQPFVLYPVIMIHSGEAIYMERSRLQWYNVPRFTITWWKWMLSTFIEGTGAFIRFDRIVKEEKMIKARTE